MEITVETSGFEVEVLVINFTPGRPPIWGPTPEDSAEAEPYDLDFDIVSGTRIIDSSDLDYLGEFPSRESIEEAVVAVLH